MIQNKKTFFIAIFILIVEIFLGIPSAWKMWLIILSGVYLALSSVKIILPSKKSTKVRKPREKVLSVAPIVIDSVSSTSIPSFTSNNTDNEDDNK